MSCSFRIGGLVVLLVSGCEGAPVDEGTAGALDDPRAWCGAAVDGVLVEAVRRGLAAHATSPAWERDLFERLRAEGAVTGEYADDSVTVRVSSPVAGGTSTLWEFEFHARVPRPNATEWVRADVDARFRGSDSVPEISVRWINGDGFYFKSDNPNVPDVGVCSAPPPLQQPRPLAPACADPVRAFCKTLSDSYDSERSRCESFPDEATCLRQGAFREAADRCYAFAASAL